MPARKEEVGHAKEEGVEFSCSTHRFRSLPTRRARSTVLSSSPVSLVSPMPGRRRPVEIGSEKIYDFDTVIVAIGNDPTPDPRHHRWP